jgi:hypothetical protein
MRRIAAEVLLKMMVRIWISLSPILFEHVVIQNGNDVNTYTCQCVLQKLVRVFVESPYPDTALFVRRAYF